MIRILIADDHTLVREGLKKILKEEVDMTVAGEAHNAAAALEFLRKHEVDVVVLDISMPGKSGLDAIKDVRSTHPKLPVLVLSMHPEDRFAIRALKAGASGYITKESASSDLVNAIRKVCSGRKHISSSLAEKLASRLDFIEDRPLHESLSDREFQILRMIASAKSVGDIAEELSLSISTINTYRTRILEKMHMKSNVELIHYAIENHLVE